MSGESPVTLRSNTEVIMPTKKRVAITGLGILASNGIGWQRFWDNCVAGRSGISRVSALQARGCAISVAGQVSGFSAADFVPTRILSRTDRVAHLGLAGATLALEDAGLNQLEDWRRSAAVIVGCSFGGQSFVEEGIERAYREGMATVHPSSISVLMPSSTSGYMAITHKLGGVNLCISTMCSSGANAIGLAFRKIQAGECEIALTGGVEAPITPFVVAAYRASGLLAPDNGEPESIAKPFDKRRDGSVVAEGAALLVLEELEHARARGGTVYAELVGYASNSGTLGVGGPEEDVADLVRVMQSALTNADASPEAIGYVNTYGVGTKSSDRAEIRALEAAFGPRLERVLLSSSKSMLGHSFGSSSALDAALCALSLHRQTVTPTINLDQPEFEYDFVANRARQADLEYAMSNSFGLTANNTSLVLRRIHGN